MKKLFIIILTGFGIPVFAQQQVLTLEQSKTAALAHSYAIKNGDLKIENSQADIVAAHSNYLPSVSGIGAGIYGFKDFIGAYPPLLEKGINNFFVLGATGSETIYAGGKIKANSQLSELQLEVSKVIARQSVDSVLLSTEQKYWNIVDLQQQDKTLTANELFLKSVLEQQQNLLKSGLIASNDLLKVKVQLSRLLLNKSKLNNGRRLAMLDLCLYTGIKYDTLLVVKDTLNLAQIPPLPEQYPDTSLTHNYNYQLLLKGVESEKLQTKLSQGDLLPTLSAGISASQAGVINRGLGSSFVPTAFVTLNVPISDGLWGKGKQKLKQRRISEKISVNNLYNGQDQLRVGVMKNWYDMKDGQTEISFARVNLSQATENLKVNQDNYKAGLASISDLLDAQAAYQQAGSDLVSAYANFESKRAAYNFITGKINER